MMRRKANGFTLVELLIALFILTVVLLAISSMVYSIMRSTSSSRETSVATNLMQDKMETLKNMNLATLAPGTDTVTAGSLTYNRQWSITTAGNVRTITITITWNSQGAHSLAMTTLRAD